MYLLDTNVISQIRKLYHPSCPASFRHWFDTLDLTFCYLSVVSVFEIERGILAKTRSNAKQGELLRCWFEQQIKPEFCQRILPIGTQIALKTAQLHVPNPASLADSFIGATALQHNFTLVTRNIKDFHTFGIQLLNPFDLIQ